MFVSLRADAENKSLFLAWEVIITRLDQTLVAQICKVRRCTWLCRLSLSNQNNDLARIWCAQQWGTST